MALENTQIKTDSNDKSCDQCGTCCRKGGPAIHDKDLHLLADNVLRLEDLITYRPGEFVRDESLQKVVPLEVDVVKISPAISAQEHDWTCRFLITKHKKSACALHGKHPAECRALFCKNPEFLLALPADGRQTRKQIIEYTKSPDWWEELIQTHSNGCDLARVAECVVKLNEEENAKKELSEIITFDMSFRELVVEKAKIKPELLPFLFGRPLLGLMHQFKVEVFKTESGLLLKKAD